MAIPKVFQLPRQTAFDTGVIASGAKAYFFAAESTTPQATYTTAALTTQHSHPVVADAAGLFPVIYLDDELQYRVQIKDSGDALIYDQDKINYPNNRAPFYDRTQAEIDAGVTPTNYDIPHHLNSGVINVRRYGAQGDGSTDDYTAIVKAVAVSDQAYFADEPYVVYFPPVKGTGARYMVSQTITLTRNGIRWLGAFRTTRDRPTAIAMLDTASDELLLHVTSENPAFENLCFAGFSTSDRLDTLIELHPQPRFPTASEQAAFGLDPGTLYNIEDVDAYFTNCAFVHTDAGAIEIYGRGLYIDQCEFYATDVAVDLGREADFQRGLFVGMEEMTGMRVYAIRNTRFHGMSTPSACIRNVGSQKDNIGGVLFEGNYIDTLATVMYGPIKRSYFDCVHLGIEAVTFDAHTTTGLGNASGIYEDVVIRGEYSAQMFINETQSAASTTLDENESTSATAINVTATTGFDVGNYAYILLDDGSYHRSKINTVNAGVSIEIDDGLPSAASSGNSVEEVIPRKASNFLYADGGINVNLDVTVRDVFNDIIRFDGDVQSLKVDGSFYDCLEGNDASGPFALVKLVNGDFESIRVAGSVHTGSYTNNQGLVFCAGAFTLTGLNVTGLAFDPSEFEPYRDAVSLPTWGAADTTPSVRGRTYAETNTSAVTITDFDDGVPGQEVTIKSNGAITFDVTGTNLNGGTTDLVTAAGDITRWFCEDGTDWHLIGFMDASVDNSGGA